MFEERPAESSSAPRSARLVRVSDAEDLAGYEALVPLTACHFA